MTEVHDVRNTAVSKRVSVHAGVDRVPGTPMDYGREGQVRSRWPCLQLVPILC